MADDISLELWMDRRRLAALERVMAESGTDTQTVMQARFDELLDRGRIHRAGLRTRKMNGIF